jgi:hypothetical protein
LEALAPLSDLDEENWLKDIPIDPLFGKEKWTDDKLPKHMARYPILDSPLNGKGLFWDVSRIIHCDNKY